MKFLYFYRVVMGYIRENPLFNRIFHFLGVLFKFRAVQWVFENSVSRAKGFPFRINIETTNYCNARCSICPYGDMTRGKGFMDMGLYKKIIDECALHRRDIHVVSLYMHGEPLLDKYLAERVRYAKDKGIRQVHLSTNGSLLGTSPGISLLETGLDVLTISFDGMSAESYESIRCGLSFDNVFKNIDVFLNERKRRGLKSPKVILQVIKTPLNSSELNQMKKYFKPLKPNGISYPFVQVSWEGIALALTRITSCAKQKLLVTIQKLSLQDED